MPTPGGKPIPSLPVTNPNPPGPPSVIPAPPGATGTGTATVPGTGSDPLSTLAAAYMASVGSGGGGGGSTAPIVLLPNTTGDSGAGTNWQALGAIAAVGLLIWAVWTWWKHHKRKA